MEEAQLAALFEAVEWTEDEPTEHAPGALYATHHGVLEMLGSQFKVYRLNDGQAVLDANDVQNWLRLMEA